MEITFRPHHFLCTLCFRGEGYSPEFIYNFSAITAVLNSECGDKTNIRIIDHTDSICDPCPHRTGASCTSQTKITALDKAHANALDIRANEEITWGEAKKLIAEKLTLNRFHEICASCNWKAYGICEGVLREFLR